MKKLLLASALAVSVAAPAAAAPTAFGGNLYEYIGGSFTWEQALANAAAAAPVAGYTAHLVTLTSAAEDAFVQTLSGGNLFWTAGSDADVEGVWRWVAGPENGQIFFGPGAPGGAYSNWNGGEPNNVGNEDYLHVNQGAGNWNDAPNGFLNGYVVEYSVTNAVPEPAAWAMMIAGFGLAGGAMRRRAKLVFA
jgi:hypothetical protein